MISVNIFKTLYNIGHIIYYKTYNSILYLIDMASPFDRSPMKSPNQIDKNDDLVNDYIDSWYEGDDVAKMLGHMDSDGNYIKDEKYKPYSGPVCETP